MTPPRPTPEGAPTPSDEAQRARLVAGDLEGFKRALLESVELYADTEAGRKGMGSPVMARLVYSAIERQLAMLASRVAPEGPTELPGNVLRAYPATQACATTNTPRFHRICSCPTYPTNWGACDSWEPGGNGLCAYCDHAKGCHRGVAPEGGEPPDWDQWNDWLTQIRDVLPASTLRPEMLQAWDALDHLRTAFRNREAAR